VLAESGRFAGGCGADPGWALAGSGLWMVSGHAGAVCG